MATARERTDAAAAQGAAPEDRESVLRSTLDALSAHVALLDETGTIIAVNRAWREFATAGAYQGPDEGVGANYIAVCERGAPESADAARTLRALREIMAGQRDAFRMEYLCQTPQGPRWFQLRATRAAAAGARRIVVAHEDITEVKRAEDALSRLNARILRLQDDERRRIARELHDTTAQNLLAIALCATRLRDRQQVAGAQGQLDEILDLTEQSLQEVRTLSYLLHPPLLDDVGLEAALRWLARGLGERSGIATETRIEAIGAAPTQAAATALFRVAQEALMNVHRHSGSAWARVSLRRRDGAVELDVEDSGRGMAGIGKQGDGEVALGVGISGMRARLEQLGGSLDLRPRRPGLLVRAVLPMPAFTDPGGPGGDARAAGAAG